MSRERRIETIRGLIARLYPEKSEAWKEARLRFLLGDPAPAKTTPAVYAEANERVARAFGLAIKKNEPIEYR